MKQIITILALITTFEASAQIYMLQKAIGRVAGIASHSAAIAHENMMVDATRGTSQEQGRAEAECLSIFNALTNSKDPNDELNLRSEKTPATSYYGTVILNMREQLRTAKNKDEEQNLILNSCKSAVVNLYSNSDEHSSRSISLIRLNAAGQALGAGVATLGSDALNAKSNDSSINVSACMQKDIDCSTQALSAMPEEMAVDLINATASGIPRFSSDDCNCASEKFNNERGARTSAEMTDAKKNLEKELNDFIIESFGKKFINDYAANVENLDYFLNERMDVFSVAGNKQKDDGIQYQCSKEAGYRQKIQAACANSKLTPQEQEVRIQKLLSAWGKPAFTNFDEHMKKIGEDILTRKPSPSRQGGSSEKLFTREEYDAFRTTQYADDKRIVFADRAAALIIKDSSLNHRFRELLVKHSPEEAFIELLTEESGKSSSIVTELLSQTDIVDSVFGKEMRATLSGRKVSDIKEKVKVAFKTASLNHPGFNMVMNDKDKLSEFNVSPDSLSLIAHLESEKAGGFLDRKFSESCDNLQKKFAEAVCTDDEKLLSQVDPQQLAILIDEAKSPLANDLHVFNKLLCEKSGQPTPLFENLNLKQLPAHLRSHYLDKTIAESKSPAAESMDDFSVVMRLVRGGASSGGSATGSSLANYGNRRISDRMNGGSTAYSRPRSTQTGESRLASQFSPSGSKNSSSSASTSQTAAANSRIQPQSSISKDEVQSENNFQSSSLASNFMNNVSAPPGAAIPGIPDSRRDARSELRDALSNDSNKNDVENFVSNIDNSTARELASLREESLANQKKVLELSSEAERNKLKDLEKRISELQKARNAVAKKSSSENEDMENVESNNSKRKSSREIASIDSAVLNLPGPQNYSTAGVSSGTSAGSNSSISGRAGVASEGRDASNALRPTYTNSGALIISSNALVAKGQEIKPAEMNNELLKFLTQSEPDISTLMNLKTSGMVYKFKVLENGQYVEKEVVLNYEALNTDIKTLIDQKIAKKKGLFRSIASIDEELTQVKRAHSYLSLKLIIEEQTRK